VLELLQHNQTLAATGLSADERLLQLCGVFLQRQQVVRKDDNLIAASLVVVDEELTGTNFVRIHNVKQLATTWGSEEKSAEPPMEGRLQMEEECVRLQIALQIFPVEVSCHGTPDLRALSHKSVGTSRELEGRKWEA
jgi:hypothetical protein